MNRDNINKPILKCITINVDGSFCPKCKVAGYAFYIKSDLFKIQQGGIIKKESNNAEETELMALGNAVYALTKTKDQYIAKTIIINMDCINAINKIQHFGRSSLLKKVRKLLSNLKAKMSCKKIEFRHVKAHIEIEDSRLWVNDWCDKTAKYYMKIAKQEYKQLN